MLEGFLHRKMQQIRKEEQAHFSGIYRISNYTNTKIYIGCSIDISNRIFKQHLGTLRNNTHHSFLLQEHYNKYGEQDLIFDVVERIHKRRSESDNQFKTRLCIIETNYIHKLDPGFNIVIPHYPSRRKPEGYFDLYGRIKQEKLRNKRIQQLREKTTRRREYPINHTAWEMYIAYLEATYLGKEQELADKIK